MVVVLVDVVVVVVVVDVLQQHFSDPAHPLLINILNVLTVVHSISPERQDDLHVPLT